MTERPPVAPSFLVVQPAMLDRALAIAGVTLDPARCCIPTVTEAPIGIVKEPKKKRKRKMGKR